MVETITNIFIDKYLGVGWSAVALILIIGLEVWRCVLFAELFVWAGGYARWTVGNGVRGGF